MLGDYIHGGADSRGVLDKIINLQNKYGSDKVVALMGNHEEFVLFGDSSIDHMIKIYEDGFDDGKDDVYKYLLESFLLKPVGLKIWM